VFTAEGDKARDRFGLAQMVIDHAGIISLANSRAEQLFGYECGELVGCSIENLLPARTRERHRQQRNEFVQRQQVRQMGGSLIVHGVRKTGEEIPLAARIVFVCDAFDAMIAARPFGEAKTEAEAVSELLSCAGSQFDPRVVDAFMVELTARREAQLQDDSSSEPGALAGLGVAQPNHA